MKVLKFYFLSICIFCSAFADDINNPIDFYNKPLRLENTFPTELDSTYAGSVEFLQLPQYNKTTQVLVKHVCLFETNNGFTFKSNKSYEGTISIDNTSIDVLGKFSPGDTVSAIFNITPMRVGNFALYFYVYEASGESPPYSDRGLPKIGGYFETKFSLGINGQVVGIMSDKCDDGYASPLGLLPSKIEESLIFYVDPKPLVNQYSKGVQNHIRKTIHRRFFSIIANVYPKQDLEEGIEITLQVSPYHNFLKGIGFMILHPVNAEIFDCSPSVTGIVDSSQTYDFSTKIRFNSPGIYNVGFLFRVKNPEFREEGGVFSKRKDSYYLGTGLQLYIGINENNDVFFISEQNPFHYINRPDKLKAPLGEIDKRFDIIDGLPLLKGTEYTYGSGYNEVIKEP